nr:hypothetical protein DM860_010446 [Ipomoea batatas]
MQPCHIRLDGEDAVPDLREGADDDAMVVRRIELEKAVEELLEVVFGVDVLLQDHLEHGVPEIEVRVVGVFLDGHALAADSPEALHRPEALDFGVGVGGGVGRGERRGGGVPRAGGVVRTVHGGAAVEGGFFMVSPWFGVEDGGEFGPPATPAAAA